MVNNSWTTTKSPSSSSVLSLNKGYVEVVTFPCSCHKGTWKSGGDAPLVPNLDIIRRWVVSFTPRPHFSQGKRRWCPLKRWLDKSHSRSGRFEAETDILPLPGMQPQFLDCPARIPVTALSTIPWRLLFLICQMATNYNTYITARKEAYRPSIAIVFTLFYIIQYKHNCD
jgi:hypothetical protein